MTNLHESSAAGLVLELAISVHVLKTDFKLDVQLHALLDMTEMLLKWQCIFQCTEKMPQSSNLLHQSLFHIYLRPLETEFLCFTYSTLIVL